MSGHSKWATIKRQKGVADIKRGLTFTKLSNAITIAVKKSGGITDINSNFKLRLAVEMAKANNMPKETIERAIERAAGKDSGIMEEALYEGFAPGGISVMVEAATDNPQRTSSEIKNIFNKEGGNFGQPGSVAYQFRQVGKIVVSKQAKTFDEIFEKAIEENADDILEEGENVVIYTPYSDLSRIKDSLAGQGLNITSMEIIMKPLSLIGLEDKELETRALSFLDKLEDNDDVQKVYSNLNVAQ